MKGLLIVVPFNLWLVAARMLLSQISVSDRYQPILRTVTSVSVTLATCNIGTTVALNKALPLLVGTPMAQLVLRENLPMADRYKIE